MKFKFLILVTLVPTSTISCVNRTPNTADTKYLTDGNYQCFAHPSERIENVRKMLPDGMVSKEYGGSFETALNRIAGIPDEYINHLVDRYKSRALKGIYPEYNGEGVAGLTRLQGNGDIMFATSITTTVSGVGFALQHEIGHAMEGYVRQQKRKDGFDQGFQLLYQEVTQHPKTREYAKSDEAEAWAEAFANFYCSPESKAFIEDNGSDKKRLAGTAAFLKKVLLPPQWESGSSPSTSPSPLSNQLFVRFDPKSTNSDAPRLQFAVPLDTATIAICENVDTATDCNSNNMNYQTISAANKTAYGRKLVSGYDLRANLTSDFKVSIVALNSSGSALASRVLTFESAISSN